MEIVHDPQTTWQPAGVYIYIVLLLEACLVVLLIKKLIQTPNRHLSTKHIHMQPNKDEKRSKF